MTDAMDVDIHTDVPPRCEKRKADALDDIPTPRRIKVGWFADNILPSVTRQPLSL